ncbi:MAG: hypothetical protein HQM12_23335, partial [SAR324 cluster bacterium]|nr:hypothetical protein [SAR324 cluster bacterium]
QLKREGRLHLKQFPEDWQKITDHFIMGVHYDLKKMDTLEFLHAVKEIGMDFYSLKNIAKRALSTLTTTQSIKECARIMVINLKSRKSYVNEDVTLWKIPEKTPEPV